MGTSPLWSWLAMAATMALIGSVMTAWALLSDRSRGRKRCPECWYDMSAAAGLICPECGHDAERSSRLEKTRRRWVIAGIGMVIALGSLYPAVRSTRTRNGLWPLLPTAALVTWFDLAGWRYDPNEGASRELFWRFAVEDVNESQRTHVFNSVLPTSIMTRPKWPASLPLRVLVRPAAYYNSDREYRLFVVTPVEPAGPPLSHTLYPTGLGGCFFSMPYTDPTIELVSGCASHRPVRIAAELTDGFGTWTAAHTLDVDIVSTLDDAIAPMKDARVNELVRTSFGLVIYQRSGGQTYLQMHWGNRELLAPPGLNELAFGIRLEFRYGDEVVAISRFCFMDRLSGNPAASEVPMDGDVARLFKADVNDPLWTVTIAGDGEMALRRFDREKYWAGSITAPMSRVLRYVQVDDGWRSVP